MKPANLFEYPGFWSVTMYICWADIIPKGIIICFRSLRTGISGSSLVFPTKERSTDHFVPSFHYNGGRRSSMMNTQKIHEVITLRHLPLSLTVISAKYVL